MKKRPSLSAVSGRTCPHCLIIIDAVCYGWHVGKCSSKNLASTVKEDMAPRTPFKNETAGNSHFVDAPNHVLSSREAHTLAPDCQIIEEGVSGRLHQNVDNVVQSLDSNEDELHCLREENHVLKNDLKLKSEENAALNDMLKDLELKLVEKTNKVKSLKLELEELRLKLSKEAPKKAMSLPDSSRDSPREGSVHGNEEAVCRQPIQSSEAKALGPVNCSSTDPGDSNNQFCYKLVEVVDSVKEKNVATDSTKSHDVDKKLDLDRVVDLACGEGAVSHEFPSQVEGVIKAKEAVPSTVNASRKQRILSGVLCNASNEEENIIEKSGNQCSTEISPRYQHLASHSTKPFQNVADKEVPCTSPAPRDAIGNPCVSEDVYNTCCPISLEADGDGDVIVKEDSSGMKSGHMPDVGAHGLASEKQIHDVDTCLHIEERKTAASSHVPLEGESELNAKQIMKAQLHSSSATTEPEIIAVKAKSGFRRMVLQSDSESSSGNMQGLRSERNTNQAHLCDSKKSDLPPLSSDAENEKSEGCSKGFRVKDTCISGNASQPCLRRSKRLNVVCISDQSDDVICKGETEQSNGRNAEAPRIAVINLEGAGVDGIPDREHAGVRRSKRLREMSIHNSKNRLQEEDIRAEKLSSSGKETSRNLEGSEVSKSGTSASIDSMACKTQVKRKGPSRTQKRLFEEVESRPLYGNKHSSDSEEDDSEIESDADSLKGFITESEGRESSGYSSEHHLSSSSYSSREVYCDPRHKRDIKIRSYVWELEGEMLSMLAIDPPLCLRAVCALNRRQTEDEQKEKISKYTNKRGFDKLHATRGSRLAEFLTGGDISGPVKKSVEDLAKFDAGGLKFCQMLASKHSKQLFEMYTNAEDPHFPFA